MTKKKQTLAAVPEENPLETQRQIAESAPDEIRIDLEELQQPDPTTDIVSYLAGRGIVHVDAINVPHDREVIVAVVRDLKMQGKLNSDGARVWL